MNIMMTTDTAGGVWTYTVDLIRALAQWNVKVTLATMGAPLTPDQWLQVKSTPNLTVHESNYKLEWMENPWSDVERAGEWLVMLEEQVKPNAIHLNGYSHGACLFAAPKLIVAHSCVASWWQAVYGEEAPASLDCYRRHVTAGLRGAQSIVAPTRSMLNCIEEIYTPQIKGTVIPNGRDPSFYSPMDKRPVIVSAGRLWDEAKNITALANIAGELPWQVCVAGDNAHPDGGFRRFKNLRDLGALKPDALAKLLSIASIYAHPARYEPFGLTPLEAALSGCTLVLGDIPSLREIWDDAAVFVPPNDHCGLRDALLRLIDDDHLRMELTMKSIKRARLYTAQRMATEYLQVYRGLTGRD